MATPLQVVAAVTAVMFAYNWWLWRKVVPPDLSGDAWYMRRAAFTDQEISPPYCWRPLLPILARWFGFSAVSYSAIIATPLVLYGYLGGGWSAAAIAVAYIGTRTIFSFNVKNPDYAEGLGGLLLILGLWGMRDGWPAEPFILILAVLCREALGASLAAVALFVNPILVLPVALGGAAAYLTRKEDRINRHPLTEDTSYGTLVRWMRVKRDGALHYAHTLQPTRLLGFVVPFGWAGVGAFERFGLVGVLPVWLLALPGSGQSRHLCYGFAFFAPFAASLAPEWAWGICVLSWFWPIDYSVYDETGGQTFGFAR